MIRDIKRNWTRAAVAAAICSLIGLFTAACGIPEFEAPNKITHSRILALRTEPREAAPGDEVTVTGLAVNGDGSRYAGPIGWFATGSLVLPSGDTSTLPSGDFHIQLQDTDPFIFTIPTGTAFEDKYGPYSPDGVVLTIAMAIAKDLPTVYNPQTAAVGLMNDPIIAIKSFIVKDNPEKKNPVFHGFTVLVNGRESAPNGEGIYAVGNVGKIKLVADVDFPTGEDSERTFHWYTATAGLQFNVEKATSWALPKKPGIYNVFCVARENTPTTFGDGEYSIHSAGIDWTFAQVQVTGGLDEIP